MAALGTIGWFSGRWACPPLDLVEAWERTRWQRLVAAAWQLLLLSLAVAAIVVAVLLAK
jgi:hypothetical protein